MNKHLTEQLRRIRANERSHAWFYDYHFKEDFGYNGVIHVCNALGSNRSLLHLAFDDCGVISSFPALEKLFEAVQQHPTLTELSLKGSRRERADWRSLNVITRALSQDKKLRSFSLQYAELGSQQVGQIANALKENKTITSIDVSGNPFGNQGLSSLLAVIEPAQRFEILSCEDTGIDVEGAKMIATFLKTSDSLKFLNIENNTIGSDGIEAVADAIRQNHSLEYLYIGSGSLTNKAATDLAAALKENRLKLLKIKSVDISPASLEILVSALAENQSLKTLDFTGCKIGDEGAEVLAEALAGNHSLKSLVLPDSSISLKGFGMLATKANPTLDRIAYNIPQDASYRELFEKMRKPESLTARDFTYISERILPIVHTQLYPESYSSFSTPEALAQKLEELARIIEPVRLRAQEAGVQIGSYYLLTDYLKRQEEALKAAEAKYLAQITAPTKNELKKYAERNGLSLEDFAHAVTTGGAIPAIAEPVAGFLNGKPKLADLEALLEWNKNSPITEDPTHRTAKQFIAHSVIPHLDYFVMFAMQNEDLHIVPPDQYPLIQTYGNGRYILNEAPYDRLEYPNQKVAKMAQAEVRPLDLESLREGAAGPHMDKIRDALAEVNGRLATFELAHTQKLTEIASIINTILEKEGRKADVRQERERVKADNKRVEREIRASQKVLDATHAYNTERFKLQGWDHVLNTTFNVFESIQGWGGLVKSLREGLESTIPYDAESGLFQVREQATSKAIAKEAIRAQKDMITRLGSMVQDVRKYDREIKQIERLIGELVAAKDEKQELTQASSREAIRELFLARYILEHGMQNSRDLEEICEANPKIGSIDNFLDAFDRKSRIGEALQNLSIGYADSNDLCVIIAEVNGFKPPLPPAQECLQEFSDALLIRTSEGAFFVTEKFTFQQRVGKCRAIHGHKTFTGPCTVLI